ncbi:MAG: hypothetical protein PVG03_17335 [Desulfarculaceae bacterium]|jgi:hypothetical protein
MHQQIFDLNLSVEATSLYLLMVSLSDSGTPLEREIMLKIWNSTPEKLDQALKELAERQVAETGSQDRWHLLPSSMWTPKTAEA